MKQGNEEKKLRCECGYKLIDVGLFQPLIFSTGFLFRVFSTILEKMAQLSFGHFLPKYISVDMVKLTMRLNVNLVLPFSETPFFFKAYQK